MDLEMKSLLLICLSVVVVGCGDVVDPGTKFVGSWSTVSGGGYIECSDGYSSLLDVRPGVVAELKSEHGKYSKQFDNCYFMYQLDDEDNLSVDPQQTCTYTFEGGMASYVVEYSHLSIDADGNLNESLRHNMAISYDAVPTAVDCVLYAEVTSELVTNVEATN